MGVGSQNQKLKPNFSRKEERKEMLPPRKLSRGEIKVENEIKLQEFTGNGDSLVVADTGRQMAAHPNLKTETTTQTQTGQLD